MPQDIPVEASETLAFSPPSLANIPVPPTFVLRAATSRDKRHYARLIREEGLEIHDFKAIRAEVLKALDGNLWTREQFDAEVGRIKAFWEQSDDFAEQQKLDPDLAWTFDPVEEARINDLINMVAKSWRPLRQMLADNGEYGQMTAAIAAAVVVMHWSGLDLKLERDRGYLSVDCACDLREALWQVEQDNGLTPGQAWSELTIACLLRFALDKDEEKNSVSPAPSSTSQALSNATNISEPDGPSLALPATAKTARSKKTRAPA